MIAAPPPRTGKFARLIQPTIRQTRREIVWDYAQITLGCLLMAITNVIFWVPHSVVSGGVTGIAIILHYVLGLPVGLVILVLNVPLLAVGLRWAGGLRTGIRTIYAVVVLSLAIELLAPVLHSPTDNPLLYITYGSLIEGVALGFVFRAQGTTGGADIIGRLLRHFTGLEISRGVFIANALVTVAAAIVFGLEKAMYGIMVAALSSWAIDVVLAGGRRARQVIIVSSQWETVRDAVLREMVRGVTIIQGKGAYTGADRPLLLVVIAPSELAGLRRLVMAVDQDAFVIVAATTEVWGEGFSSIHSEV
jgi:uncharacterized membrane-anchored protein YitT (DUF2179 family)